MCNIGLVGLGALGKNLLRNLYEMKVLRAACDLREDLLKQRSEQYPGLRCYGSISEMLKDDELQAVAIASSAAAHYQSRRTGFGGGFRHTGRMR